MERKTIVATEGRWLTNGVAYGKTVHLGINDTSDNWYEISDAEYEEKMKEESLDE